MQVTLDSGLIQDALKTILRLASPASGLVTFEIADKIYLHSSGELNQCSVRIPGKATGEANFAIAVDTLKNATKGRPALKLEYKNTLLYIRSGNYRAELATVDAVSIESNEVDGKVVSIAIDAEQAGWLKTSVANVALKPNVLISSFMPLGVKLSPKGAYVACFDTTHMSFLQTKSIKGDAEFILPLETMQAVLDVFAIGPFTMSIADSTVICKNKQVSVRLAVPNLEDGLPTIQEVIGKSKEASKAEGKAMVLPKDELISFLDNSRSVAVKERSEVTVAQKDNDLIFKVQTVSGTVQAKIPFKSNGKIQFNIDSEYFEEVVRKSGDTVEMRVVDDAFVLCKTEKTTLIVALNQ